MFIVKFTTTIQAPWYIEQAETNYLTELQVYAKICKSKYEKHTFKQE